MDILNGFVEAVQGIWNTSGIISMDWRNYVMIAIACVLIYLAIGRQFEPLLLLPISFGIFAGQPDAWHHGRPDRYQQRRFVLLFVPGREAWYLPAFDFPGDRRHDRLWPLDRQPQKAFCWAPPPSWVSSLPLLVPSCWDLTCSPRVLSVSSAARMVLPLSSLPVS